MTHTSSQFYQKGALDEGLQLASSQHAGRSSDGLEVHHSLQTPASSHGAYSQAWTYSSSRLPARPPIDKLDSNFTKEAHHGSRSNIHSRPRSITKLQRRRRCLSLVPLTIWLGILILLLIAAIAAVAAVLGSRVTSKSHTRNHPATSTSSSTPPGSSPTSTINSAGCTPNTTYPSATFVTFTRLCNSDISVNKAFYDAGATWKIQPIASLEQCIDACAMWALESSRVQSNWKCVAVTWGFDGDTAHRGACWMKNRTDDQGHPAMGLHSAILL